MGRDFHVLIVDDDHGLCQALSGLIREAGYLVGCLSGQEKPYHAIREAAPDLVILDIPGAESPAMETLRRLELLRGAARMPIIVISRHHAFEYELLDIFDFLHKPLDEERLIEDIALLASRRDAPGPARRMQPAELELFRGYLAEASGLHFDQNNLVLLERGLLRRMRAVKARDFVDYFKYLKTYHESRTELKKLLGLLTVGETYFFRYMAHYEALAESVLPEIIERNRKHRCLRIWSAGCSTGEEPYSIAMLLMERFPELRGWSLTILATDINKQALNTARKGLYRDRSLRATEEVYQKKYFSAVEGGYVVDPAVMKRVSFRYLNLIVDPYPSPKTSTEGMDLIFCRNVMIYFQPETTRQVVNRLADCLRPGGYLFLGHSESLSQVSRRFERVQYGSGFFYRLSALPKPESSEPQPIRPTREVGMPPVLSARDVVPVPLGIAALEPPPCRAASEPGPEQLYDLAHEVFEKEDFKTAEKIYAKILAVCPNHLGALTGLGFCKANRGDYEGALGLCERVREVNDLYAPGYFLKGLLLEIRKDEAGAVQEYQRALLLEPDNITAHYNLSRIHRARGKVREARRSLRNALRYLTELKEQTEVRYAGGLAREAFIELCRRDMDRLRIE